MRRPLAFGLLALTALTLFGVVGCGGGGGTSSTPPTLDDGWAKFAAGDYTGAIATFSAVLDDDPSLNDGHNGRGWAYAFDGNLTAAKSEFEKAISNEPGLTDAHAGLCSVLLAMGDYSGAIDQATMVLDTDSQWDFSHFNGVDHADVRLIRAQAYFAQGSSSFGDVQSDLDVLMPANGLDPNNSSTWNGQPTYAAALLRALQTSEESVGAQMMLPKRP